MHIFVIILGMIVLFCDASYAQKIENIVLSSSNPVDFPDIIKKSGSNQTIKAKIYIPLEGNGPYPAMVISHSSGGVGEREDRWAKLLNKNGIAAIVPDTFGSRGVNETATNQGKISFATSVVDSISAFSYLYNDKRIDNKKIGIIGFSRGGIVSNILAHKPYMTAVLGENKNFVTHVSMYPGCNWRIEKYHTTGAPMLFLLGEKDDQTPASTCNPVINSLKSAGTPVEVKIYKGAHHAFDKAEGVEFSPNSQKAPNCPIVINDNTSTLTGPNVPVNITIGKDWFEFVKQIMKYCGQKGSHTGSEQGSKALENANFDTIKFLERNLKK
jgi:dienelactone hydrolase